jgi:hypothetical protein
VNVCNFLVFAALPALAAPQEVCGQDLATLPPDLVFAVSGGYWEIGSQRGQYRLLVFSEGFEHVISTVFLQWLREPQSSEDAADTTAVVATAPVLEINDRATWSVGPPILIPAKNGTTAVLQMTNSHMPDEPGRSCLLVLGAPGHYIAICKPE